MGQRRNITSPQTWQPHNLDFLGRLHILILWSVILRLACRTVRQLVLFGGGAWKHTPSCATYRASKHRGCVLDFLARCSWLALSLEVPSRPCSWQSCLRFPFRSIFAQSCRFHKSQSFFPKDPIGFYEGGFSWPNPGASESQPASLPVGHQPTFLTNQQPCFCLWEKSLVWSPEL